MQAALKAQGYKQQEVASNLDYLIQKGWAREVVEERSFTTSGGTRQSAPRLTYKISDLGIDKLEGASTYKSPPTPGINVTTIRGVTVIGDGNVVNTSFADAAAALTELRALIATSQELSDEERLNAVADIDSLQGQLQKPQPNASVVQGLWAGVQGIAAIGGFVDLAARVSAMLGPLLGS